MRGQRVGTGCLALESIMRTAMSNRAAESSSFEGWYWGFEHDGCVGGVVGLVLNPAPSNCTPISRPLYVNTQCHFRARWPEMKPGGHAIADSIRDLRPYTSIITSDSSTIRRTHRNHMSFVFFLAGQACTLNEQG